MAKVSRRYNWHPSLPDHRDLHYTPKLTAAAVARHDNSGPWSKIFDQGQIGSCTGNAIAGAMRSIYRELTASRLFIYYFERAAEGTTKQDAGANIRDGIKVVHKIGAPQESVWPYLSSLLFRKPLAAAVKAGAAFAIAKYERVKVDVDHIKSAIAEGLPVVGGFSVYESFESPAVAKSGMMPTPKLEEKLVGGHAVYFVGFDDETRCFIVANSWGVKWGLKGYFYMPYDIVVRGMADDFWALYPKIK